LKKFSYLSLCILFEEILGIKELVYLKEATMHEPFKYSTRLQIIVIFRGLDL
jgi:hypothetical protein